MKTEDMEVGRKYLLKAKSGVDLRMFIPDEAVEPTIIGRYKYDAENNILLPIVDENFKQLTKEQILNSNKTKSMQTLNELKFQNFVKKNGAKIVALSEKIDKDVDMVNGMGEVMGDLYNELKNLNRDLTSRFDSGDKENTETKFNKLSGLSTKLLGSKEYIDLVKVFVEFSKLYTSIK